MAEMADKEQTGMVETPEVEELKETPKEEPKVDAGGSTVDVGAIASELEKTRDALKKANKEAAERRKRLEELEAAERQRAEAEMTEAEKRDARIKELEAAKNELERSLKQKEYAELQMRVAKAVAKELELPFDSIEPLASRLRGETEDDLVEDAKTVFAILPKPQQETKQSPKPKIEPTNPGDGKQGETHAQKRARILGTRSNPFSADDALNRGGGVVYSDKGD